VSQGCSSVLSSVCVCVRGFGFTHLDSGSRGPCESKVRLEVSHLISAHRVVLDVIVSFHVFVSGICVEKKR
jgi:hypothetical protein